MHVCHSPDSKIAYLPHFGLVDPQKRKYQCEGSGLCPACLDPVLKVSPNQNEVKTDIPLMVQSEENGLHSTRFP